MSKRVAQGLKHSKQMTGRFASLAAPNPLGEPRTASAGIAERAQGCNQTPLRLVNDRER